MQHTKEDGNWENFFTEEIPENAPHKALFLSFLELFKYAQQHLNTLTQRHLDFYYKTVLRLREKPATPDQVHLLFQLAKNVKSHLVKAGTLLKAGKDATGKPLYYATEKDIIVNKAKIGSLKTLFVNKNETGNTLDIRVAPVANSADGLGADHSQWDIFGNPTIGTQATLGFAIASPLLLLGEGQRSITMLLTFSDPAPAGINADPGAVFDICLSGPEGWIPASFETYTGSPGPSQLGLAVSLSPTQPEVIAYSNELHGGGFDTPWPMVKIMLKNYENYDALRDLSLQNIALSVNVTGVSDLVLQNDQGILDPARPFLPFGSRPVLGSSFYIGSAEIFRKEVQELTFNIEWLNAPSDLPTHYAGYGAVNSGDFEARLQLRYRKSWVPLLLGNLQWY